MRALQTSAHKANAVSMETGALINNLKDIQARTEVLRGYL